MKRSFYYIPLVLVLVGIYLSCGRSPLSNLFTRSSENKPDTTVTGDPFTPPGTGGCGVDTGAVDCNPVTPTPPVTASKTDSWTQPTSATRPIDIIVYGDTSGSLDDERPDVSTALGGMLSTLESKDIKDYCLGVVLMQAGNRRGLLRSYGDSTDPNKLCVCRTAYSTSAAVINQFKLNYESGLSSAQESGVSIHTDGGEAGLYSFSQSITNATIIAKNKAAGCFRDTAALIPIFVSDENDISTSQDQTCGGHVYAFSPSGPDDGPLDTNCEEAPARLEYYSDSNGNLTLGYNQAYNQAKNFQQALPFMAAVVGYIGTVPVNGENGHPWGYSQLADLTGGDQADMAYATAGNQAAFNASFDSITSSIILHATLQTVFDLSSKPCIGSLVVKVNGVAISNFTWNGNKRVTIPTKSAGKPGQVVAIKYNICGA